jgi:CheY-like chemotaxis protein
MAQGREKTCLFFRPGTFRFCSIGTTFWSMRIRGTPQAADDAETALAVPLILLVEDDFVLRSSLSELLIAEGFRVECAADGREALRRLDRLPAPNLILLDIMLPYLDGFELRALQKRSPLVANIPVLVISAHDVDPKSVEELGLPPPFRKPLDVDKLLSSIRHLTDG